jgi:TPR repeat protein
MTGEIVEKNETKGFELIKGAAIGGNSAAMESLSMCYRDGKGCTVNMDEAFLWNIKWRDSLR